MLSHVVQFVVGSNCMLQGVSFACVCMTLWYDALVTVSTTLRSCRLHMQSVRLVMHIQQNPYVSAMFFGTLAMMCGSCCLALMKVLQHGVC